MRSTGWILSWLGLGVLLAQSGCSHLPARGPLAGLGLPSPRATIAASQQKRAPVVPASQAIPSSTKHRTGTGDASVSGALERGRTYERAAQHDKARKVYETALRSHPHDPALLHRLGVVADMQKKHAEAEQYLLAALNQQPQNAELLGDLGYCYFLQGKLAEARSALTSAVSLAPGSARQHNNLGLVLGHMQDYDGAFAQFAAGGNPADAYYNMAFVFAAQNLTDEAKGCFQEALAIDPSHDRARTALASFEDYDAQPAHLRDAEEELADSGVRYVPYIEDPDAGVGDGAVQQASAQSSLPATRDVGRVTRTLQLQSRGLLGRHMQQQRNSQAPSASSGAADDLAQAAPQ